MICCASECSVFGTAGLAVHYSLFKHVHIFSNAVQVCTYDYSFLFTSRSYTLRRVRDYFREKRTISDPQLISKEYTFGLEQLEMLQRQVKMAQFQHCLF